MTPRPMYVTIPLEEYEELNKYKKLEEEWKKVSEKITLPLEPVNRWHKFSDEIPKENDYYLVSDGENVFTEYGCYNEQDEEWKWDHNGEWEYWMPLPKPPKEAK